MLFVPRSLVVLSVLLVSGCAVHTNDPLSDPLTADADESLYGHWLETKKEDGKTRELHAFIGKHTTKGNPKSIMEIALVYWQIDEKTVQSDRLLYFTTSAIAKTSYINLMVDSAPDFSLSGVGSYAKWTKNEKRACVIFRYSCDGKKLELWSAKESKAALKKLSEAGEVKLIHRDKEEFVTSDSLVKYLAKNGGESLFNDPAWTFSKVP